MIPTEQITYFLRSPHYGLTQDFRNMVADAIENAEEKFKDEWAAHFEIPKAILFGKDAETAFRYKPEAHTKDEPEPDAVDPETILRAMALAFATKQAQDAFTRGHDRPALQHVISALIVLVEGQLP